MASKPLKILQSFLGVKRVHTHTYGKYFYLIWWSIHSLTVLRLTFGENTKSNPLNLPVRLSIPYTSEPEAFRCIIAHIPLENEEAAPHRSVSHLVWQSSFKLVLCHLLVSTNQNVVLRIYCPWVSFSTTQTLMHRDKRGAPGLDLPFLCHKWRQAQEPLQHTTQPPSSARPAQQQNLLND